MSGLRYTTPYGFLVLLNNLALGIAMHPYIIYLAGMNLLALAFYVGDKLCARAGWRRVPERNLLLMSFAGGAAGGLAGMLLCRHKIRKPYFFAVQVAGIVLHGGILVWSVSHFTA